MLTPQQRLAGLTSSAAQHVIACTQALEGGRLDEAERSGVAALALAPGHPEALRLAGSIQVARGRNDEAVETLVQSLKQRPADAEAMHMLAHAYIGQRDMSHAFGASRRACELAPERADFWFTMGQILITRSQHALSVVALQHVLKLAPGHVGARITLAHVMNADGRVQESAAQYREILAADPAAGQAWWGLATLKPMPLDTTDIAQMQRALSGNIGYNDRIATGFALAHALEQARDYPRAFAVLRETNATANAAHPWQRDLALQRMDKVVEAFSSLVADAGNDQGAEIVFITSMPRSGSTLTEQILASHSQIEGTSELPDVLQVIVDESDRVRKPFPDWVPTHTEADWRALGQRYMARTARWRKQRPRMTDKMPGNWLYVGVIQAMLPQARIIVARRDPLETCFGCYRYLFTGHEYTHSFDDLGVFWTGFDRLCDFWERRHPNRVRQQRYEDLIGDPEGQIRALLEFCGLPFEEACLNFHQTERRVTTPSAGQVREPIRRDTARSDKYGALLDPLRKELRLPAFAAK